MADEGKIVKQIIERYGEVINLRESPETIIDILRRFPIADLNGGAPPGGTPPTPPGPSPAVLSGEPTIRDIMKELLRLSKQVSELNKRLG